MNNHLTQEQIISYIHHTLTDAEPEELDQHLASCAQCRALLTEHETVQQGELLDLAPYSEQGRLYQKYDFYLHAMDLFKQEDYLWAIPISVEPMVMYYNKDLFDQHSLSYPKTGWTWHDFKTIVNTISNP